MLLKPTTIYVNADGNVLEQSRKTIYRYSDINEIRLVTPLAVEGGMRVNFLLGNGVTIEQKVMTAVTTTETVNGEEWNVWSYRPTNVITATITAQNVATLQLSFTQITVVGGKTFGNTFGTTTLSIAPTIEGPEPTLADATALDELQDDITALTSALTSKVDENLSGYSTLTVTDEDATFVYVNYNGGSYKVSLQSWINLVNAQFTGLVTRVQTLEGRVNQDVRTSASPQFVATTIGGTSLTSAKIAGYDTHVGITNGNPHGVDKADLALENVTNHAQVKKAASSTDGRVPKWSGTAGDAIVDGFDVKTTITDSDTDLPTGKAVKTALNGKMAADAITFITSGTETGKISSASLPSYVDDVIEVSTFAGLPATGESGKIYYVTESNITYRWTGNSYVNLVGDASQTGVTTTSFAKKLSAADNTVQKALDTLDDHTHTYEQITEKPDIYTEDEVDLLLADKVDVTALSSSIILYPTTTASDVSGYFVLAEDNTQAATNVPTGVVSNAAFPAIDDPNIETLALAKLVADAGLFIGNPGVINITVLGEIRKTAGGNNQGADFIFRVFKRDSLGNETLVTESNPTKTVTAESYEEFFASALLNNGEFVATDRLVYKFYGRNIGGGSPQFEFLFGGDNPVRALLPLPVNVTLQANRVSFDPSTSDLTSTNVQDAIVELDELLEEGLTVITVPEYTIVAADDGSGGFTYDLAGATVTGTKDGSKFVFTLPQDVEYETGTNRLSIKVDGSDGALKRLFYGADTELTEPSTTTFAIDYALADGDKVFAKVFQSLATVTLNIADGSVTQSKIANGAVTTNKIAANAVELTKIQEIPTARILGNDSGANGVVEALTAAEAKTLLGLENVSNTADASKPVSQAQQIEFDKVNNATEFISATNSVNSDFVTTLTNGLTPNAILTVKFPASAADDTQQARLSIDGGSSYFIIQNSAGTDLLGSSVTNKTLSVVYSSGTSRFVTLAPQEIAYTAFGWGNHASAGYLTTLALDGLSDVDVSGVTNGQALVYDDATSTWIPGEGGGGASVTVSDTAPDPAEIGDLWFDSTLSALFIYYNDGNSTQWVEVTYQQDYAEVANYSTTIAAADTWTDQTGYFTLGKTVTGIVDTDKPIADLNLSAATVSNVADIQAAWATIYRVVTTANTVTFYALEDPTFPENAVIDLQVVR